MFLEKHPALKRDNVASENHKKVVFFFLILTLLDLDPDSPALINADPDPQHNKANPELECITAISKEC
jgi:hypothetical protein